MVINLDIGNVKLLTLFQFYIGSTAFGAHEDEIVNLERTMTFLADAFHGDMFDLKPCAIQRRPGHDGIETKLKGFGDDISKGANSQANGYYGFVTVFL